MTPDFQPLMIPWTMAYWTSGPEFAALGLANGAAAASWPDEVGANDLVNGTGAQQPTLLTAAGQLGGKPALDFDGVDDVLMLNIADINSPYAAVVIGSHDNNGADSILGLSSGSTAITYSASGFWYVGSSTNHVKAVGDGTISALFIAQILSGDGTLSTLRLNEGATNGVTGAGMNAAIGEIRAGNRGTVLPFDGKIAFIGIFTGILSAQQRFDLREWSKTFYGLP